MNYELKIELPSEIFSALRTKPEDFILQMRIAASVKWYELGKISQSKAAEIAGVTRHQFLEALNDFNVSPFQVDEQELLSEISND